jgi:hypothetical protein
MIQEQEMTNVQLYHIYNHQKVLVWTSSTVHTYSAAQKGYLGEKYESVPPIICVHTYNSSKNPSRSFLNQNIALCNAAKEFFDLASCNLTRFFYTNHFCRRLRFYNAPI